MNKDSHYFTVLIHGGVGLLGCACSAYRGQASSGVGYDPDYAVAVIQTSRQLPSTHIDYYDEGLKR